jgi:hypothetical protein
MASAYLASTRPCVQTPAHTHPGEEKSGAVKKTSARHITWDIIESYSVLFIIVNNIKMPPQTYLIANTF